jgi:restriction endonuclease S subunit
MSSEWSMKPLGELLALQRGHDLPADSRTLGIVPVMGSAGITGFHNKATTVGPGVVIGRSGVGSMGVVSYIDRDYWALNTALYVTNFRGNDVKFIYYLLRTINFRQFDTGSAQASLNRNLVYPHCVLIPNSKNEQIEIGKFLTSLDDRINLLSETNATLEAIAQALFKSWFVDFDPVRAKMEGRLPEGMDEATAELFPNGFEESGLGMVPLKWSVRAFRETIDVIGGGTPKTSVAEFWGGEIPWFSVVDAPRVSDVFVVDTEKHITEAGLNGSSTKLLPTGTTIISARGTVGRLALTGRPMAMNQSCYGLRGKAGDDYFTYLCTTRLVEQLKQRAHGSVFDTITQETFSGVSVCYPSLALILSFEDAVRPMFERVRENLIQARCLAELRDSLLPRLISGQLRLPEAEIEIEGLAA